MAETPRCPCSGTFTTITFHDGVRLQRCSSCGGSTWLVDDCEVDDRAQLHDRLRTSFVEQRAMVPRQPRRPRRRTLDELVTVVDLREVDGGDAAPTPEAPSTAPVQLPESLITAVLAEKGLGNWRLLS